MAGPVRPPDRPPLPPKPKPRPTGPRRPPDRGTVTPRPRPRPPVAVWLSLGNPWDFIGYNVPKPRVRTVATIYTDGSRDYRNVTPWLPDEMSKFQAVGAFRPADRGTYKGPRPPRRKRKAAGTAAWPSGKQGTTTTTRTRPDGEPVLGARFTAAGGRGSMFKKKRPPTVGIGGSVGVTAGKKKPKKTAPAGVAAGTGAKIVPKKSAGKAKPGAAGVQAGTGAAAGRKATPPERAAGVQAGLVAKGAKADRPVAVDPQRPPNVRKTKQPKIPVPKTKAELRAAVLKDRQKGEAGATLKRLRIHELADLLADPATGGINTKSVADIALIQDWLRAHGYKVADPRGKLGAATAKTFQQAYNREQKRTEEKAVRTLRASLYDSGLLVAGAPRPGWLPEFVGGKTPNARKLAKLLHRGGITAVMLAKAISSHLQDPHVSFRLAREAYIDKLYSVFAPPARAGKLGLALAPSRNQKLATILLHPSMGSPQAKAQMRAFFHSTTAAEFAKKVAAFKKGEKERAELDKLYPAKARAKNAAMQRAYRLKLRQIEHFEREEALGKAKKGSKLASALGAIERVGDAFREDLVASANKLIHGDPRGALGGWANSDADRQAARESIANLDPVQRFVFEVAIDPLNFVPGVGRAAGEGVSIATALTGRGIRTAAERDLFKSLEKAGIRGAAVDDALKKLGREVEKLGHAKFYVPAARRAVGESLSSSVKASRAYRVVHVATRMKTEAMTAARKKVEHAAAHGFSRTARGLKVVRPHAVVAAKTKPKPSGAAQADDALAAPAVVGEARAFDELGITTPEMPDLPNLRPGKTAQRHLDTTEAQSRVHLAQSTRELLGSLHAESVSLYARVGRDPGHLTSVGASIRARYAATVRVIAVHEMARQSADDVIHKYLIKAARKHNISVRVKKGRVNGDDLALLWANQSIKSSAKRKGEQEFDRVRKAAGSYIRGRGEKDLVMALRRRVASALEMFDSSILPILQNLLEEMAEAKGLHLFDETGRWIGGEGGAQAGIRGAAHATFENAEEVPNPLFGVELTAEEVREVTQEELAVRIGRVRAFYAREVERGNPRRYKESWLDTKIEDIEKDVFDPKRWETVHHGHQTFYKDTRKTIEESSLYVGHLDETLHVTHGETWNNLGEYEKKLAAVGMGAGDVFDSKIAKEIGDLAWAAQRSHDGLLEVGKRNAAVKAAKFRPKNAAEAEVRSGLEKAILERYIAVLNARNDVFGRQLAKEGAFYAALQHAQSRPLRVLHYAVAGPTTFWRFATLPLSPAWGFRNIVDNNAKALIHGVRDPRAYLFDEQTVIGGLAFKGGRRVKTIFDHNLNAVRFAVRSMDAHLGTNVAPKFDALLDTVWDHADDVLSKLFALHGIDVPVGVISDVKRYRGGAGGFFDREGLTGLDMKVAKLKGAGVDDELIGIAKKLHKMSPAERAAARSWKRNPFKAFHDGAWDLMGNRPEDAARRRIYRHTYHNSRKKYLKEGMDALAAERKAFEDAVAKVEKLLFDYSKISVLEHNVSLLFPFVQYWRKNSVFWAKTMVEKPWVPLAVSQWEEQRAEQNQDWAAWMRRYVSVKEISDVTSRVPGLAWLGHALEKLGPDLMYDPLNLFSFRPLWALFKSENPNLPADKLGWRFIRDVVDVLESANLGINPIFRRPLASAGIINQRNWRSTFPQTPVIVALTRKYISEHAADILLDIDAAYADPIVGTINALGDGKWAHEVIAENFEELVRYEMVNQVARGEKADRAKAEKKVRGYQLVQAVFATFTGIYTRKADATDIYLAKLEESAREPGGYDRMSDKEKALLSARGHARHDPYFDNYLDTLPLIQAYYHTRNYEAREKMKREHPEIIPYVEPAWRGDPFPVAYIQKMQLIQDTDTVAKMSKAFSSSYFPYEVRQAIRDILVTPKLERFWAENDTPKEVREKMQRAQWYAYLDKLDDAYYAIPENDYDAKQEFLRQHPELWRSWQENNTAADDFALIINTYQADLRNRYFEYVDAKDWAGARQFLHDFPFTFDKVRDGHYIVDRKTGRPKGFAGRHGRRMTAHARDYLANKKYLDQYFAVREKKGKKAAAAWLRNGSVAANKVLIYFAKYADPSKMSVKAKAYIDAEIGLNVFFDTAKTNPEAARKWLASSDPEAVKARNWLSKYGKKGKPKTQKAKDYTAAKKALDHYFSIKDKKKRAAWLASNDPLARKARAFFNKYPPARGSWQKIKNEHGGYDRVWVPDWKAIQTRDYLKAKDSLDAYFKVKKKDRAAWLIAHPKMAAEVLWYFGKYADGGGKLSVKARDYRGAKTALEHYYNLPARERDAWLHGQDPRAQRVLDWFQKYGNPVDRASFSGTVRQFRRVAGPRTKTQHSIDFLDAKPALDIYFGMPEDARAAWLKSDDPAAKKVRDYLDKYSHFWGANRQSMDYRLAKAGLDYYFSLSPAERSKWLRSGSEDAALVRYYFKTYATTNRVERSVTGGTRSSDGTRGGESDGVRRHFNTTRNPRLRARLDFWRRYFQLSPSERLKFIHDYSRAAGVFVYGVLGEQKVHDREMRDNAWSEVSASSEHGRRAWNVKALLDLYYSLSDPYDRELMRRGNPELAEYLDGVSASPTGDETLDAILAGYFRLPFGSALRSAYLVAHPEVQLYFDERAEASGVSHIRETLNVYFSLGTFAEKREFLGAHPEVQDYFDRRKWMKDAFDVQAEAFDAFDPRLAPFRDAAAIDIGGAAARMRWKLALQGAKKRQPNTLARRSVREPIY